jgi:glycosyltransferase involved in cell wall biosynthesis
MQLVEQNCKADLITRTTMKTLLIVGPLPPPIGGSPLTVQEIINELTKHTSIRVALINTSPSRDPREKMTGFNLEKVRRMLFIILKYLQGIHSSDATLIFANNLFTFILVPVLLPLARLFHKAFYIKPVGGDLDLSLAAQRKPFRDFLLSVLRATDGILVQTRLLQEALTKSGCTNTHYLPGCRSLPQITRLQNGNPSELQLIFLSHITRDKGSLILLEALQILAQEGYTRVSCDFYGPVHDEIREEFFRQLEATPNAHFCGMAETGTGSHVIAAYDALVLPTYFCCEGHPGVIIEAMHAGVPVISTQHRAIPELVTHGENGILVPVQDSYALAKAIRQIALDRPLRERMGHANYRRGQEFRTEVVVAQMMKIIFPE